MKIYVDFDGVILDTDSAIDKVINTTDRREFIKNYDWFKLMDDKLIINNSIGHIKKTDLDVKLLTKVSTICEAQAKIKYLRSKEIPIDINIVPTGIDKSDVVNAQGNILIDDKIVNLDAWNKKGGISIFFNKDNKDIDIHGDKNTKYPKINNLSCLEDVKELEQCI